MATINAASTSTVDVQAAVNSASAGDTIVIPAGSVNWTDGVTWTAPAGCILKGAGTTATGGGDQTVITDNVASDKPLFNITIAATGVFRFSGISFQSGIGVLKDTSTLKINGPGDVRVDHMHLNFTSSNNYRALTLDSGVFGVMDHCILDFTGLNTLFLSNGRRGGGEAQGNYEWSLSTGFGTDRFFFIEDNIINGTVPSGTYSTRVFDGLSAGKVVVRFNTVVQAVLSETHATGHSGDDRGLRAQEVYGNLVTSTLTYAPNFGAMDMGNGCALGWGNSWDQCYKNIYLFKLTRRYGVSGGGPYNQTATPGGWGYAGTEFNGTGSNWDGGTYNATDTTKGYPCLDMPGRGQGDLLTGLFSSKVNNAYGTLRWPNQALEPIYLWNNIGSLVSGWGGNTYNDDTNGRVVSDRDYYSSASGIQVSASSPFNGTTGCGWGTLANRPTTCTTGVGYFATDQGSWNQSTSNPYGVQMNGADGVLYVASATNIWSIYYTPYTYPHPYNSGATASRGLGFILNPH